MTANCVPTITLGFSTEDIEYLARELSPEQLRREIHHADIETSVSTVFGESDKHLFWQNFKEACQLAIEKQKQSRPENNAPVGKFSVRGVKEASDIVDVIGRYTKLRKSGKEYIGNCPFHSDDSPSFGVNREIQKFNCLGCGKHGDVIDFIKLIENLDTKEAINFLSNNVP